MDAQYTRVNRLQRSTKTLIQKVEVCTWLMTYYYSFVLRPSLFSFFVCHVKKRGPGGKGILLLTIHCIMHSHFFALWLCRLEAIWLKQKKLADRYCKQRRLKMAMTAWKGERIWHSYMYVTSHTLLSCIQLSTDGHLISGFSYQSRQMWGSWSILLFGD